MILQTRQDVGEAGLRVDVVGLGGFDAGVDGGGVSSDDLAAKACITRLPKSLVHGH